MEVQLLIAFVSVVWAAGITISLICIERHLKAIRLASLRSASALESIQYLQTKEDRRGRVEGAI